MTENIKCYCKAKEHMKFEHISLLEPQSYDDSIYIHITYIPNIQLSEAREMAQ